LYSSSDVITDGVKQVSDFISDAITDSDVPATKRVNDFMSDGFVS